jgi:hypothetical protein
MRTIVFLLLAVFATSCTEIYTAAMGFPTGIYEKTGQVAFEGNRDFYKIGKILASYSNDITYRVPSYSDNYAIYQLGSSYKDLNFKIEVYVDQFYNFRCVFTEFSAATDLTTIKHIVSNEFNALDELLNTEFKGKQK